MVKSILYLGENLILMEYEANYTPYKMKFLLSNGNLDSKRIKTSEYKRNRKTNKTYTGEDCSKEENIKYYEFSLNNYSVI